MFRIRELLHQFRQGLITESEFCDQLVLLVAEDKVAEFVIRGA